MPSSDNGAGPLADIRVLDLTRALAGPFCTMILGDLGAEGIKVEPTPDGEMIRAWGPFDRGVGVYYYDGGTVENRRDWAYAEAALRGDPDMRRSDYECGIGQLEKFAGLTVYRITTD